MGWQDRQYRPPEDEGGFRRALRRVFGEDGNFFNWALPLFSVAGIRVKLHLFFLIYIAIELIFSMEPGRPGFLITALGIFTLFSLVLLHEFGHCIACRKVGGEANEIIMWPLGGLAMCVPPHNPRDSLITTIGGPAVNLLLMPVFGLALFLLGAHREAILFNPFRPYVSISALASTTQAMYYVKAAIFSAHVMNFYLFVFNVFLPMFPMDGGRILQELLWFRKGYRRSMQIAVGVGLFGAILVGIFALTRNASILLGIAIFAGFTCWQERMRLAMLEPEGIHGYDFSRGYAGMPGAPRPPKRKGPSKADVKRQQHERELQAEIDRILAKIATDGMGSLTKREKAILKGETERKRRQSQSGKA